VSGVAGRKSLIPLSVLVIVVAVAWLAVRDLRYAVALVRNADAEHLIGWDLLTTCHRLAVLEVPLAAQRGCFLSPPLRNLGRGARPDEHTQGAAAGRRARIAAFIVVAVLLQIFSLTRTMPAPAATGDGPPLAS
jgi:hypothetical protein